VPLDGVVVTDVIVTSYVVGIAGLLTPAPTPCTIDLTSRGLPEHPPNGVEKDETGDGHPAGQDTQEHQPRPSVPDRQVQGQQLGV